MGFLSKLKSKKEDNEKQVKQDVKDVKGSDNKAQAAKEKGEEYAGKLKGASGDKSATGADKSAAGAGTGAAGAGAAGAGAAGAGASGSNAPSGAAGSAPSGAAPTAGADKTSGAAGSSGHGKTAAGAAGGAAVGAGAGAAAGSGSHASGAHGSSAGFVKEISTRRTIYALNKEVPLAQDKITTIVEQVVSNTPSSFNSQPVRAVILYDNKHTLLWDEIAVSALKKVVREENWESTGNKLKGFAAGAGTVLFFESTEAITKMQEQFPTYAANFPIWAGHSSGAAQINTWTALALEGIGANLQHYSPLIDEEVQKQFKVPKDWVLTAQLVFGGIAAPAQVPDKLKDTVRVA